MSNPISHHLGLPEAALLQIKTCLALLRLHLGERILAVHLFGSAVAGGLKPDSDIDLLVSVSSEIATSERRALMAALLEVSSMPAAGSALRPLEVTIILRRAVCPWQFPPWREFQFGEWLRPNISAGWLDAPVIDHDLAILLTKVRKESYALVGPSAEEFYETVPRADLFRALDSQLSLWDGPQDWKGDERNVVLTLARTVYTYATGEIAPKDVAVEWALKHLSSEHRELLEGASAAYRGELYPQFLPNDEKIRRLLNEVRQVTGVSG